MRRVKQFLRFAITALLLTIRTTMNAQTTVEDYQQKLESMYRNTVPLVMPGEVHPGEENLMILDTREQEEYVVSHIPGSRLVPYNNFRVESVEDLPRDARIVVYCSVGYRSERIGEKLQQAGFTNVQNLYGGIFNWYYEGGEVVNMTNQPTDSIHTYNEKWSKWCLKGEKVW